MHQKPYHHQYQCRFNPQKLKLTFTKRRGYPYKAGRDNKTTRFLILPKDYEEGKEEYERQTVNQNTADVSLVEDSPSDFEIAKMVIFDTENNLFVEKKTKKILNPFTGELQDYFLKRKDLIRDRYNDIIELIDRCVSNIESPNYYFVDNILHNATLIDNNLKYCKKLARYMFVCHSCERRILHRYCPENARAHIKSCKGWKGTQADITVYKGAYTLNALHGNNEVRKHYLLVSSSFKRFISLDKFEESGNLIIDGNDDVSDGEVEEKYVEEEEEERSAVQCDSEGEQESFKIYNSRFETVPKDNISNEKFASPTHSEPPQSEESKESKIDEIGSNQKCILREVSSFVNEVHNGVTSSKSDWCARRDVQITKNPFELSPIDYQKLRILSDSDDYDDDNGDDREGRKPLLKKQKREDSIKKMDEQKRKIINDNKDMRWDTIDDVDAVSNESMKSLKSRDEISEDEGYLGDDGNEESEVIHKYGIVEQINVSDLSSSGFDDTDEENDVESNGNGRGTVIDVDAIKKLIGGGKETGREKQKKESKFDALDVRDNSKEDKLEIEEPEMKKNSRNESNQNNSLRLEKDEETESRVEGEKGELQEEYSSDSDEFYTPQADFYEHSYNEEQREESQDSNPDFDYINSRPKYLSKDDTINEEESKDEKVKDSPNLYFNNSNSVNYPSSPFPISNNHKSPSKPVVSSNINGSNTVDGTNKLNTILSSIPLIPTTSDLRDSSSEFDGYTATPAASANPIGDTESSKIPLVPVFTNLSDTDCEFGSS